MKNLLNICLLTALLSLSLTSCHDRDKYDVPDDMVTIKMMDEDNGKTVIGLTDIYMTRAHNLVTNDYYLVDMGQVLDLGHVEENEPDFVTLTDKAAVGEYEGYLAFLRTDLKRFPSGISGIALNAQYYRIWVDEFIEDGDKKVGATVCFAQFRPKQNNLPNWQAVAGVIDQTGGQTTVSFSVENKNVEPMLDETTEKMLTCTITNAGKKQTDFQVSINPYITSSIAGTYPIYLRCGNSYTMAQIHIK